MDKPTAIKPTTWFGNPAKTAQWYKCPNCAKQSPLTLEWVDLTDDEMLMIYGQKHEGKKYNLGRMVQQALKEKNT